MKQISRITKVGLAAFVIAGLLTACSNLSGPGAAKGDGGTVTLYADMDPQEAQPLIDDFTEKTGIKVELFTGGSAAVLARWESEEASNVHVADVVSISGPAAYDKVDKAGYLAPIPDSVDFLEEDRPSNAFDPERMWFATTATVVCIAYNPQNVDESEAPKTWSDLLDSQWKGELTIPAPTLSTATVSYYQMRNDESLGDPFLEALSKMEPVRTQKSGDTVSALVTGDTSVGIANDNAVWQQIKAGAPLTAVYPSDGQPVLTNYTMFPKGAPNPEGAAQLLNYLASTDAGALYAETSAYSALSSIDPVGDGRPGLDELTAWPYDPAELVADQPQMVPYLQGLFGE